MNDSFLGRWSNRKLEKKASTKPEVALMSDVAVDNDATKLNDFNIENNASPLHAETNVPESNVIPAIPESANPSDNALAEVNIEPAGEPLPPKTGEMDTSSDLDNDARDAEPEPLLSDADMPDIQTLDASSDVSAFFNRGVSKTLRNAALKHIFGLSAYNVRDGLNDYDEDYTVFEPLGDTVTCDMKFHKERKEKLEAERLEQERLEQERLLAEAEAKQNEKEEDQAATDDTVASNDEVDDAAPEQAEGDQLVASSTDEHINLTESASVDASNGDTQVATASKQSIDTKNELQDESEPV
jgi:hypothetical protein